MGPMALGDLVGQELFWKQRKVWVSMFLGVGSIFRRIFVASQPTPPGHVPPRNKAFISGLINHWFRLIRHY